MSNFIGNIVDGIAVVAPKKFFQQFMDVLPGVYGPGVIVVS